jgi:hypothetical protein
LFEVSGNHKQSDRSPTIPGRKIEIYVRGRKFRDVKRFETGWLERHSWTRFLSSNPNYLHRARSSWWNKG